MADGDFENWAAEEIIQIQAGISLRRPSDNQSMFKYISLNSDESWNYLEKTLSDFLLVGSAAKTLNDPFELSPYVFDDLRPNIISKIFKYNIGDDLLDIRESKSISEILADLPSYREQARSYLELAAMRYRIIAFCERVDSGLLWSHYANSYQGACLHFLAKGFRWHRRHTIGRVSYSKHRPAYPLSLALSLSNISKDYPIPIDATLLKRAESNQLLFFTKADEWSYESEIRIVYDSEASPTVKFQQDSLVSIITGPRFSGENDRRLRKMLEGTAYENIAIRKADLSRTSFSVEIEQ